MWIWQQQPLALVTQLVRAMLVYILPSIIQIVTCVSICRMVYKRQRQATGAQSNSEVTRQRRIRRKKATIQLLAIILAFIVPYSLYFAYTVFKSIFVRSIEFETDYTIRAVATMSVYLNGSVNFGIHLSQMAGFRKVMKGYLSCCKCECKVGRTRTIKLNHTSHKEPKSPPVAKENKSNERRASMSQVPDAEERQKTQTRRHSC